MFIKALVAIIVFLVFVFVITQVIVPSFAGTKMFPAFNKKKVSLLDEKETLLTELECKQIEKENAELQAKLKSE